MIHRRPCSWKQHKQSRDDYLVLQRWKCSSVAETDHPAWNHLPTTVFHIALLKATKGSPWSCTSRAKCLGCTWMTWLPTITREHIWSSHLYFANTWCMAPDVCQKQVAEGRSLLFKLNICRNNTVLPKSSNIALCIYIHPGIIWDTLSIVRRVRNKLLKNLTLQLHNLFWYSQEHRSKSGQS